MNKKTSQRQQTLYRAFCALRGVNDLCRLLRTDKRRLMLVAKQPRYRAFSIPKKGGGERHIETPAPALKKVQSQLNRYLQAVYYFEKSRAAYGFIVGVRNEEDRRNVLTNAKKHLGRPYLLNLDLKDFFHSVRRTQVLSIFQGPPFHFSDDLPGVLTKLVSYKGRLPMGAPTSPVMSNLACRALDEALMQHSQGLGWVYTRYADDMSFSSLKAISDEQLEATQRLITEAAFKLNPHKVQRYGPEEVKVVTGLLLAETKVDLAPGYLDTLESDLARLQQVMDLQNFQGELNTRWVDQFRQQVQGRINFAGFVLGRRHAAYLDFKDRFYTAINPPEDEFGAVNWRSFPYNL
jgi:RNA-directed DNA polymerase